MSCVQTFQRIFSKQDQVKNGSNTKLYAEEKFSRISVNNKSNSTGINCHMELENKKNEKRNYSAFHKKTDRNVNALQINYQLLH